MILFRRDTTSRPELVPPRANDEPSFLSSPKDLVWTIMTRSPVTCGCPLVCCIWPHHSSRARCLTYQGFVYTCLPPPTIRHRKPPSSRSFLTRFDGRHSSSLFFSWLSLQDSFSTRRQSRVCTGGVVPLSFCREELYIGVHSSPELSWQDTVTLVAGARPFFFI